MKKLGFITLLIIMLFSVVACRQKPEYQVTLDQGEAIMLNDNYRVYYEIFVGAFSDASGNGMGDIQGIINRLDYLNDGDLNSGKSLGVTGLWLMPIMPSPSYHKYDTTNYKAIDPQYGTIDDFKQLVDEAQARGIDIIIDLVVNHTSSYHPWFRAAKEAYRNEDWDNPYLEYYTLVTHEQKINGRIYYPFAGDLYYEGNFWSEMPELNLDSALVRQELVDIIEFWLNIGVKGFRLDAVKYIYLDETARNVEFWQWFMETVRNVKEDAYVVGEMWAGDAAILPYYAAFNNFDFGMSQSSGAIAATANGIEPINSYVHYLAGYKAAVKEINPDAILQPFISNHDMNRAAGYLSLENHRMHMAATLYLWTYGTPFIYYGEEIGMRGSRGSENTDANRRLAMLWGDGDSVRDPIGSTYARDNQINGTVNDQISDPQALLTHYKKIIMLRYANPEIARGEYTPLQFDNHFSFGGFLSTYENSTVGVFHNTSDAPITIDLSQTTEHTFTHIRGYAGLGIAKLEGQTLTLEGLTSVILK